MSDPREPYGRVVRETWVAWALEQPDPKPSWLIGWDELDDGQREVDKRIGVAVAAAERQRIRQDSGTYSTWHSGVRTTYYAVPADLLNGDGHD